MFQEKIKAANIQTSKEREAEFGQFLKETFRNNNLFDDFLKKIPESIGAEVEKRQENAELNFVAILLSTVIDFAEIGKRLGNWDAWQKYLEVVIKCIDNEGLLEK